ncbi:hypothetical protein JTB14_011569 [Gonioctena quinquepunctata]|nr:hypothetical protein JTB14_011569 [Gonioctena quinquepunctata]
MPKNSMPLKKRKPLFLCNECEHGFKLIPALFKKVESLEETVQKLKDDANNCTIRSQPVPELTTNTPLSNSELMHVFEDRTKRTKNVMIYNVNEITSRTINERINHDTNEVNNILTTLGINENPIKIIRLAKLLHMDHQNLEQLFVSLVYGKSKYIIGGLYIPPISDDECYTNHVTSIENLINMNPEYKMIIFGDYNLTEATWTRNNEGTNVEYPPNSKMSILEETFNFLNLEQVNLLPNINNRFLDLCFSHIHDLDVSYAEDTLLYCGRCRITKNSSQEAGVMLTTVMIIFRTVWRPLNPVEWRKGKLQSILKYREAL